MLTTSEMIPRYSEARICVDASGNDVTIKRDSP